MNVLKLGRKVLTVSTVFSTILWSVGVAALVPAMAQAETCPTFKSGDLIKVSGKPAIYAVDSNGKVLYFPSGDEFKSWNADEKYGGYTTISQACYDALPVPSMAPMGVNFRAGSYVVKRSSSDQLYVVEPNNTLAKITPEAAKALYGTSYKVKTVADVFWTNYVNRGADVTEAKAHPGMVVSNGGKTYYVNADGTLSQVSATGFTANRFKQAFVRPVSDVSGFTMGSEVGAEASKVADRTQTGGGSTSIPGGVVSGGAVSVALAMDNPAGTYIASGSAFNQVLKLTLTAGNADVAVTGLQLKKSGFSANSAITGIDIVDALGVRHGNVASSIDTDNNVNLLFSGSPIVVKANSSQTVTVRVNVTGTTGTLQLSVAGASSVTTNGGSVSGNFPVSGNIFTLQDGSNSVATVLVDEAAISGNNAAADTTKLNVDAANEQEIAKFSIGEKYSKENISLSSLTVYNNGTAADTDVQDVQLVAQDNTVLATAQQSNKTVVFNLATPYVIDKGTTKNFTVRAKVVNGAARTIQYVIYNDYDVVVTGVNTGASVLPCAGGTGTCAVPAGTDTNFPIGNNGQYYNMVTIGSGSLSFNKDASSPSTAVSPGSNSVVLAKYFVKRTGENMELRKVQLAIVTSSASVITGSVVVRVNGASVYSASPEVISGTSTSPTVATLSTYPILTAGQNSYITVEANIMSGAASAQTATAYLNLYEVKRLVTNDLYTPVTNIAAGNQIAVQAAALKVTTLATPVATSLVAGTSNVVLANVEFSAGAVSSGEDVRVSRVVITDTWTGAMTDIGNLALFDSNGNQLATTASTAQNQGTNTFNLATPFVVSKAGSVTLTLKGDVLTGSTSTHKFAVANNTAHVTAVGVSTGNSLTSALTFAGSGQLMSITGSGTLTLSAVTGGSAAPSIDQNVLVGQTAVPVFAFKLTAQNEPIKVTALTLNATGTLNTVNGLVNLKLYRDNDTQPFATAAQMVSSSAVSNTSTYYTWNSSDNLLPAAVQPGTPVTIYVKADIGVAGAAVLGDNFRFSIASGGVSIKGASSGSATTATGAPAVSSITYVTPFSVSVSADYPTAPVTTLVSGARVATVKITNNGTSQVTVTGVRFNSSNNLLTGTYALKYSSQNSTDYNTNSGPTSTAVNFTGGFAPSFTIDGGSYRFVSVYFTGTVNTGDSIQLGVANIGDVTYSVTEANLGYDGNNNGSIANTITGLTADGRATLSTISKP